MGDKFKDVARVYEQISKVPEDGAEPFEIRKLRAATLWFIKKRSYQRVSQILSNVLWFFINGGDEVGLDLASADYNPDLTGANFPVSLTGDMSIADFVLSLCNFKIEVYDDILMEGNRFLTVSY